MAATELKWTGTTDGDWQNSTNYDPSSADIPTTNDTVIVPKGATVAIDTNLENSTTDLAAFIVEEGCAIAIGTAANPLEIGLSTGAEVLLGGTGEIHVEFAGDATGAIMDVTGAGSDKLFISGYNSEEMCDTLNVKAPTGTVHVGWNPTETAQVDDIVKSGACTLKIGDSVTKTGGGAIDEVRSAAGTTYIESALTLLTQRGGTVYYDEGALATGTIYNGTCFYRSNGTLGAANIYTDGKLDLSKNAGSCTITAVDVHGEGEYDDPNNVAAVGTTIDFNGTASSKANVNFGANRRITTGNVE